jgi:phage terminase Nu1 subunit (DNA packaging protein)
MSVNECVTKLVQTGKITKALGDEALALYERSKGEFSRNMGPADADAAAALATARAMQSGAKKLKNDVAKQAIAFANFERTMLEHPDGPIAGVMDQLTQSLRSRGTRNVDAVREDVWNTLSAKFGDAMEKYAPGLLGSSKAQLESAKNLIREVFGVQTGDNLAAAAAKSWADVRVYGEDRARAAGKNFEANENWRVPQPWNSNQARKVSEAEFVQDFKQAVEGGGIARLWDTRKNAPATSAETDFILKRAYADITGSGGGVGTFSPTQRTFEFADGAPGAEAWLKLQGKYGVGDNVMGLLTGHMNKMASEIAMAEVIAPNHRAAISAVIPRLKAAEAGLSTGQRLNPVRMLESAKMVQKTYDVLNGSANVVEGPLMAGILGGLRSISTAAQLKGAILSAIPGDSVTAGLAANFNGMPIGRLLSGIVADIGRSGADAKNLAARLNLTAHAAMDFNHGYRFFQDQVAGPAQLRFMATAVVRAQGLQAWTEMMKRVFTMEFMGHLADHTHLDFPALEAANKPLADFLGRYGVSPAEWDKVRAAPLLETNGTKFLDTTALADQKLAEKIRTGVIQERRYAVLEPDSRSRAITTGGQPQGTFLGELNRNIAMFKSFSVTMAATHMMRIMSQDTWGQMAKLGLPFVLFHFMAGAAAIQAKNLFYGKDPQAMDTPKFWLQSLMQGGGLGVYGDVLNSAFTRNGRSPLAEVAGPVGGIFEDALKLSSSQARKLYEGKDTNLATELTRVGRRYTPGTFYSKLAVDRLLWDNIQQLVDPDYRGSFRRMEETLRKDTGQQYWWQPGENSPGRGPDLGAVRTQ